MQCPSNNLKSKTPNVVFYTLCLLYILCTATFVCDLLAFILEVSNLNNSICNFFFSSVAQWRISTLFFQLEPDSQPLLNRIVVVQNTVNACCDFTSQCIIVRINRCIYYLFYSSSKSSKIYRCWIVWGQNIRFVIIPSFLAITSLGQSIDPHLISRF